MSAFSFNVISSFDYTLELELCGNCDFLVNFKLLDSLQSIISPFKFIVLDCRKVEKMDFMFFVFLKDILDSKSVRFTNTNKNIDEILFLINESLVFDTNSKNVLKKEKNTIFSSIFHSFSVWCSNFYKDSLNFLNFCGACLWYFLKACLKPSRFIFKSILYHMNESGFKALPIVLLTVFIVSYAIALQGIIQLDKMGVPLMSVEIVAKLSLREMGPFILAIVIAGRSSSSFSAQLGVMNLTEETDALKTMNLNVFDYLVLPRILALVIVMPLLVFLADGVSLFAAMSATKAQAGINFIQYLERFYEYVDISHFLVGLIKAPFFGAAIALVGCYRGLYIKGDTESVGIYTTKSVLNALFWIILINAIFSIITLNLNI